MPLPGEEGAVKGYMEMYETREKFRKMPRGTVWSGQRIASRFIERIGRPVLVLDYGCGTGSLKQFPAPNATMLGYDIDPTNRLADFHSHAEMESKRFDVIIMSHLVEHVSVSELHDILTWAESRCKFLIIMTPLVKNPFVDFWYDPTHIRPWGSEWLAAFLDYHGFEPLRILHTNIADGRLHWYTPFRILANMFTGTPAQYELTMICVTKTQKTIPSGVGGTSPVTEDSPLRVRHR
jgi:SAM-dependent methyltransferase